MGWWSTPRPGRLTPGKETRYPLHRRLGGSQGRSGRVRKITPPPGIDAQTVQPVASRYTGYAIPALWSDNPLNFKSTRNRLSSSHVKPRNVLRHQLISPFFLGCSNLLLPCRSCVLLTKEVHCPPHLLHMRIVRIAYIVG
jgi:hypothetical protein